MENRLKKSSLTPTTLYPQMADYVRHYARVAPEREALVFGDQCLTYKALNLNIKRSSWICILVRGKFAENDDERILAHSSSVMVEVDGSEFFSRADAVSILEQIEGSVAYLDHVGTRAETKRYKEMRLVLEQAHKKLHDRLHQLGFDHSHTVRHKHH